MNEDTTQKLRDFLVNARNLIDDFIAMLTPPITSAKQLEEKLPEDLRPLVTIEETNEAYIVKPRQFLGTENFTKILNVIRQHGGQYVSAGKDSRFEIPRRI